MKINRHGNLIDCTNHKISRQFGVIWQIDREGEGGIAGALLINDWEEIAHFTFSEFLFRRINNSWYLIVSQSDG